MRYLVENKIILDSAEITYIFVPKRIKNIYFRFKDDGKLYVSGPSRIQKNIERLLLQNKGNILKLYEKDPQTPCSRDADCVDNCSLSEGTTF